MCEPHGSGKEKEVCGLAAKLSQFELCQFASCDEVACCCQVLEAGVSVPDNNMQPHHRRQDACLHTTAHGGAARKQKRE